MLLIISCTDRDKVPSGIIPRDKMEKVLWDMIQADQYAALYLVKDSAHINVKMETLKLYEQVFQLNKVSRDEFKESYLYYLDRPDLTRPMFDSLLAEGNRLRADSYKNPPVVTPPPAAITPATVIPKIPVTIPVNPPANHSKGTKQQVHGVIQSGRPRIDTSAKIPVKSP
jgi:hypothetical protein